MKRRTMRAGMVAVGAGCALALAVSYVVTAANTHYTEVSVSRTEAFSSIEDLRSASEEVVVATVESAREFVDKGITATEYELIVSATNSSTEELIANRISLIQDGPADSRRPDQAFHVEVGSTYLLFLLDSNATGTLHQPYYVTGVWAGIYKLDEAAQRGDAQEQRFIQVVDEADDLPPAMTLSDAVD